jgi:hypothetical protein
MFSSPTVVVHEHREQARVGRDLLPVGRLMRFVAGAGLIAAAILTGFQLVSSPGQIGLAIAALLVSALAYTGLTWLVGDRLFARVGPWLSAIVLVAPATLILFFIPTAAIVGYDAFLGVSMLAQAAIGYGGCEILGIPTLALRRRYTVYCAMNGGDFVERGLRGQAPAARWALTLLAFIGTIMVIGAASDAAGPLGEGVLYLAFLVVGLGLSWIVRSMTRRPAHQAA